MIFAQLQESLKQQEGFRSKPYLCPQGFVTIGYGHNLEAGPKPVRAHSPDLAAAIAAGQIQGTALLRRLHDLGMAWSMAEAEQHLADDLALTVENLSLRCRAYRALANIVAAEHAGKSAAPEASSFYGMVAAARAEVLINMAFNLGVTGLRTFTATLDAVERGDYEAAASHMLNSRWAAQVGRRAVELAHQMRTGMRTGMRAENRSDHERA